MYYSKNVRKSLTKRYSHIDSAESYKLKLKGLQGKKKLRNLQVHNLLKVTQNTWNYKRDYEAEDRDLKSVNSTYF